MSFLISRVIFSNHLWIEPDLEGQVPGTKELLQLINGESTLQETSLRLKEVYDRLPTPKLNGIAAALLSIPLPHPLLTYFLTESAILCLRKQEITLLFEQIRHKIYPRFKVDELDSEITTLADQLLKLSFQGHVTFHEIMETAHRESHVAGESLFRLFLEKAPQEPSLSRFTFKHRRLCPWDAEELLRQHLFGNDLKLFQQKQEGERWRELRLQFNTKTINDLFLSAKADGFGHGNLIALLIHFIELRLPQRYPQTWSVWVNSTPKTHPDLIRHLFSRKHYELLSPFLKKTQVLEYFQKLSSQEKWAFCVSCLLSAEPSQTQPFLNHLLQEKLSLDQLDQICILHAGLMPQFLKKALDAASEPIDIHLSEAQKQMLAEAPEKILFSIVNHIRLAESSKKALWVALAPHVPSKKTAIWYDLLDPAADEKELPPLFVEERNQRRASQLKEQCRAICAPNDALLQEALQQPDDTFALLVDSVVNTESKELARWLLQRCPSTNREATARLICTLMDDPESRSLISKWIEQASLKELFDLILQSGETNFPYSKQMNKRLELLPPDQNASRSLLNLAVRFSLSAFPWRHWFHFIQQFPDAAGNIAQQLVEKIQCAEQMPLVFSEEMRNLLNTSLSASSLLQLFAFSAELPAQWGLTTCHELLQRADPETMQRISPAHRTLYLEKAVHAEMSQDACRGVLRVLQTSKQTALSKRFAPSFFSILIARFYGHPQFIGWANALTVKWEEEWSSFDSINQFQSKNVPHIPIPLKAGTIDILLDPDEMSTQLKGELILSSTDLPKEHKALIQASCVTSPKLNLEGFSPMTMSFDLHRQAELVYLFIESLSAFTASSPGGNCLKNLMARSLMRELLVKDPYLQTMRLRKLSLNLYFSLKIPIQVLRYIETRGFLHLSVSILDRFKSSDHNQYFIAFEMNNLLTCGKINQLNTDYFLKMVPQSIRISMNALYEARSMNWNLVAQKALDNLAPPYITDAELQSLKKKFQDQAKELLPKAIENPDLCQFVLDIRADLLFSAVRYWNQGTPTFKETLLSRAQISFETAAVKRDSLPLAEKISHLTNDAVTILLYKKVAAELGREGEMGTLCRLWIEEVTRLFPAPQKLTPELVQKYEALNHIIFRILQEYQPYFLENPEAFIKIWSRSRSISTHALQALKDNHLSGLQKLYAHNQKTRAFYPLVRQCLMPFLLLLDCEFRVLQQCGFAQHELLEIRNRYLNDLFPEGAEGRELCIEQFLNLITFNE